MSEFRLGDYSFDLAVVEVRYDDALNLWDRAGSLWNDVRGSIQGLDLISAEPNKTAFRLNDRFEFVCELKAARVIDTRPDRPAEELRGHCSRFFSILREKLSIAAYTRVGFRTVFKKSFASIEDASRALHDAGALRVPVTKAFNLSGPLLHPEVAFRLEGDGKGVAIRAKAEERKTELNFPTGSDLSELATIKKRSHTSWAVLIDADYYLSGTTPTDQLDFNEWCRQVLHMANRDLPTLFGG